jgi:hypothetical protein
LQRRTEAAGDSPPLLYEVPQPRAIGDLTLSDAGFEDRFKSERPQVGFRWSGILCSTTLPLVELALGLPKRLEKARDGHLAPVVRQRTIPRLTAREA